MKRLPPWYGKINIGLSSIKVRIPILKIEGSPKKYAGCPIYQSPHQKEVALWTGLVFHWY
jgi:hypothetical protein